MEVRGKQLYIFMDIAQEMCTESFYTVNSGLPRIAVTAVGPDLCIFIKYFFAMLHSLISTTLLLALQRIV